MREAIIHESTTLPEGLSTLQHAEADRLGACPIRAATESVRPFAGRPGGTSGTGLGGLRGFSAGLRWPGPLPQVGRTPARHSLSTLWQVHTRFHSA